MLHRPAQWRVLRQVRCVRLLLGALALSVAGGWLAPQAVAQVVVPRPEKGPTTIDAESIEGVSDLEVTARGKVEVRRDDTSIFSDFLKYNREFERFEADGGVRLQRGNDRFFGPRLRFDAGTDSGVFEEPTFIIQRDTTARGKAGRMEFVGRNRLKLEDASFTTCDPGKEDWRIEAREMELDYDAEVGTVRGAKLKMFDTTVAVLPWGTFPLEHRRKSGFLTPKVEHSTRRGLELNVPYYWNIAPEQDATITPVYMSKRGVQLKGDYRYLDPKYTGSLRLEHMAEDTDLKRSRTGFSLLHTHQFSPQLLGRLDVNKVTDDRYFVDLHSTVRNVSIAHLQREGFLQYSGAVLGGSYYLQGRVQRFQTLQDPLAPVAIPYQRVPQINLGVTHNDIGGRFDMFIPAEYVRFGHPTRVEAARMTLNPTLTMPIRAPGYHLTPKVGLRHAGYDLNRAGPFQPDKQSVTTPWMSVDSGLTFERSTRWFGESLTHTLEPRLYYLRVPFRNQNQVPLFDTGLADFSYAQIFSENRFAGGDRIGDADEATLAITSRMLSPGGAELLRATVAQRYYFKDEQVGLTPTSALRTYRHSDLLASVGGRLARHWTFDASMQYNPRLDQAQRYSASMRFSPEIAKVVNASYRFNRDNDLRQADISGQWPVATGWYAIGRYNYSFRDKRLLEGIAGLEYNAGCWAFRGVFQRIQASTTITSTAFLLQLEFTGFGQIGTGDAADFLKRNIPGYAVTNPGDRALTPPSARPRLPFEQIF